MTVSSAIARFDRASLALAADWLAVAVAAALPWSTTATAICIVLWLLALLPTLDVASVRRELETAAGGLPVLLWCLGVLGMAWADVSWHERFAGLDSFHRLLVIPLLLAQYRRSAHGMWVLYGFLVSAALVLLASYVLVLTPGLTWRGNVNGVPVHDDIFQGSAFLICAFALFGAAGDEGRRRHWPMALGLAAIGALFLANFAFAVISRIVLLVGPVLAALLGWRELRWKGVAAACLLAVVIGIGFWSISSHLRLRMNQTVEEIRDYRASDEATSLGLHAAFLKGSLPIVASAPIIGHGTGTIFDEFRKQTAGKTGAAAVSASNPHNQTFAVAIQLGLAGALVLWAMWIAHLLLFRGKSLAAWFGLVVVLENIVSSTFHSHLFDFNNGWLYVFGVGVVGGMALQERDKQAG